MNEQNRASAFSLRQSIVPSFSGAPANIPKSIHQQGSDKNDIEAVLHDHAVYVVVDGCGWRKFDQRMLKIPSYAKPS